MATKPAENADPVGVDESDSRLAAELENYINAIKASVDLQLANFRKHPFAHLLKLEAQVIIMCPIPAMQQVYFTRGKALALLEFAGDVQVGSEGNRKYHPLLRLLRPAVNRQGVWGLECMDVSVLDVLKEFSTSDCAAFQKVLQVWADILLHNKLWKWFKHINRPESEEELIVFLEAVTEEYKAPERTGIPDFDTLVSFGVRCCRALLGLVSPDLGHLCSLEDLKYIWPSNATQFALAKDIPRLGRSMVLLLRKDEYGFFTKALDCLP